MCIGICCALLCLCSEREALNVGENGSYNVNSKDKTMGSANAFNLYRKGHFPVQVKMNHAQGSIGNAN